MEFLDIRNISDQDIEKLQKIRADAILTGGRMNPETINRGNGASYPPQMHKFIMQIDAQINVLVGLGFAKSEGHGMSSYCNYSLLRREDDHKPLQWFKEQAKKDYKRERLKEAREASQNESMGKMAKALEEVSELKKRQEDYEIANEVNNGRQERFNRKMSKFGMVLGVFVALLTLGQFIIPLVKSDEQETTQRLLRLEYKVDSLLLDESRHSTSTSSPSTDSSSQLPDTVFVLKDTIKSKVKAR